MPLCYETIAGRVTNPGGTLTALTADTGDSFTIRNFTQGTKAYIDEIWQHAATPGVIRVRSPRMHDNVQNLRLTNPTANARALLPMAVFQMIYPQDVMVVEMTGGGAETDVGVLQLYYTDVPGLSARLATWEQILPRVNNILTVEVDIPAAATLGDWSAGTPINTTFDLLKANVDYAFLGYECSGAVAAVAIRGPDTGNVKVGGPGTTEALETRDYWIRASQANGDPMIPIVNAANKGGTLAYQVSASAGATTNVGFVCAELKPTA